LSLRIKLEWKGSGNWKTAGEYRFINYDITGYAKLITGTSTQTNSGPWSSGGTLEQNSAVNIQLLAASSGTASGYLYEVDMKGTIYQAISDRIPAAPGGNPCNPWTIGGPGLTLW
jgi:hypothetical protein